MFRDLISESTLLDLPVLGMLFFITVFAVVVLRVLSRRRTPDYERLARLPLDDSAPLREERQP